MDYSTGSTIQNILIPNSNPSTPSKTGMLFAQRKLNSQNQIYLPRNGNQMPSLYQPFRLGSYTTGLEALYYLGQLGFQYKLGLSFQQTFIAPNTVVYDDVAGTVTLQWNSANVGIEFLVSQSPTGSVMQGLASGTIRSVSIVGNTSFLVLIPTKGSAVFNTNNQIQINALLSYEAPEPQNSDPVCVYTFWYFNQYIVSPKNLTSPDLWLSVSVANRDTSISPSSATISLTDPELVTIDASKNISLTYDVNTDNLGLLPTEYLGGTTVTQTTELPSGNTLSVYYVKEKGVYLIGSGDNQGISYSTDGINWLQSSLKTKNVNLFYYANNTFIASTDKGIYYSADGVTWNISNLVNEDISCIHFAQGKFLIGLGNSFAGSYYSTDGINWIQNGVSKFAGITFAKDKWVAATKTKGIYTSDNGIDNWVLVDDCKGFNCVVFYNDMFIAGGIGATGSIVVSSDGTTWTDAYSDVGLSTYSISYNGKFFTAGTNKGILYSEDGLIWSVTNNTTSIVTGGISFDDKIIVAGTKAGIYHSTDGKQWDLCTGAGSNGEWFSIVHAVNYNANLDANDAKKFLACNNTGVASSVDGVLWIKGKSKASGTYNGYKILNNKVIISVVNITGDFSIGLPINITLDSTQNGFKYINDKEISCFALGFNVPNRTVLETTYADFYNAIMVLQSPQAGKIKKYNVQGYIGYAPKFINEYPIASITAPDTTAFKFSARLDIPTAYQYPCLGGMNAVMSMYMDLNNDIPYYACSGSQVFINQQASTNQATFSNDIIYNQLTEQGVTVFVPSTATGLLYVYRNVCTLQTVTGKVDGEYRYEETQQKIRWIDKNAVEIAEFTCINTNGTRKNNTPLLTKLLQSNLMNMLTIGANLGMLGTSSVKVELSTTDITRYNVTINTSIIPANSGSDIFVYVNSYTV